jgi:hypothetical protein
MLHIIAAMTRLMTDKQLCLLASNIYEFDTVFQLCTIDTEYAYLLCVSNVDKVLPVDSKYKTPLARSFLSSCNHVS